MAISAKLVKQLRDITGAGMMDCKKALVETDGDVDAAAEYLQKKGIAKAAKKAGRIAAEGLVDMWRSEDGTHGVLVEVNCETDFVSRNDNFQAFVAKLTNVVGGSDASTLEEALALDVNGKTLEETIKEQIATIGENIQLRRFVRFASPEGTVASYLHAGNQIGVLIQIAGIGGEEGEAFGRDVAMHIAAMNPGFLTPDDIDADVAAKQEEIFTAQVIEEGKPENIVPRIVQGKMAKWRKEQALLEQPFVKNPDQTVAEFQKASGANILGFARYQVGEGIEKKETSLADEVAQLQG